MKNNKNQISSVTQGAAKLFILFTYFLFTYLFKVA